MDVLQELQVHNPSPNGCNDMPHLSCANLCKVTIEVPKDDPPNLLKIHQDSKDISKYVQLTAHNVEIENLMIRGKGGNRWEPMFFHVFSNSELDRILF